MFLEIGFIFLSIFAPLSFSNVAHTSGEKVIVFNTIGLFYNASIFCSFVVGFWLLYRWRSTTTPKTIERNQVNAIIFGSTITVGVSIVTSLLLPLIKNNNYGWIGHVSSLIFTLSTVYAIVRFNFLDIKIAFSKINKYTIFSIYAYITFYGLIFLYTKFFGSVTATEPLLIGVVIAPLFAYVLFKLDYLTDRLNRRLFGELHRHADVLNEVSHFLSKNLVREDILRYIENVLNTFFEVKDAKVLLGHSDLIHLDKTYAYVNKIKQDNGSLISIFLPYRPQGEEYGGMDLEMVQAIGSQLSVALERSELYERVSHFAEYLEAEVKKKTEQVNKQKDELAKLLKSKDEILHIVNHQLSTPLSIIKSAGGMVRDGLWTQEKFFEVTTRESERLGQIIKDFWQAEDTADYKKTLKKEKVDLAAVIEKIVEEKKLFAKIRSGEVGLRMLLQQNLPKVMCDPAQITQVISNYLDNAIAYTKKGTVSLILRLDSSAVMCEVSDSGIGFTEKDKEKLFSKFVRTEEAQLLRPSGSGLGLYICKRIVEAHGGLVWANSQGIGKGSVFGFSLPLTER